MQANASFAFQKGVHEREPSGFAGEEEPDNIASGPVGADARKRFEIARDYWRRRRSLRPLGTRLNLGASIPNKPQQAGGPRRSSAFSQPNRRTGTANLKRPVQYLPAVHQTSTGLLGAAAEPRLSKSTMVKDSTANTHLHECNVLAANRSKTPSRLAHLSWFVPIRPSHCRSWLNNSVQVFVIAVESLLGLVALLRLLRRLRLSFPLLLSLLIRLGRLLLADHADRACCCCRNRGWRDEWPQPDGDPRNG